ncbi:MFS general substrate transporter [Basidiobolus meristosporus CBS 931.73]|uniref:MFS general substrate transporter n=1 Tax=Basidiobolus meristosporus CBS 931.73 TaxID=1314790 RepID=A0A1Y1XUP0_9FUNG|nr:MFS general substrate transporter [Basidiobolus meristosporus CBS 931.73]|eukprot:ORX89469.1 MFS general substrate transporter [Basidiobolus meristosporus CBS 931.73]
MEYFGQSSTFYINSLSTIYLVVYPILFLPSLWVFELGKSADVSHGGGLRQVILVGAFLNCLGALFRFFGGWAVNFWVLFFGQFLAAAGQVFILGIPPRLASVWFGSHERNTASAIGVTANNLGVALGFLLSPVFIRDGTAFDDIPKYLLYQFLFCGLILIFVVLTFDSRPKVPPSCSVVLENPHAVIQSIKILLGQWSFILLFMAYGIVVGGQYAVSTLLAQIILPMHPTYTESAIGQIGFWFIIAGVVSSILCGLYLDQTYRYREMCRFLFVGTLLSLLGFHLIVELGSFALVFGSSLAYGFFSSAIISGFFQYAGELYYPLSETTSAGLLNSAAQIFGILFIVGMDFLQNEKQSYPMKAANWILIGFTVAGVVLAWCVDGNLNRKEIEDADLVD